MQIVIGHLDLNHFFIPAIGDKACTVADVSYVDIRFICI